MEYSATSMSIVWGECNKDGGSPITGYHVERKERDAILWTRLTVVALTSREFKATGLTEVWIDYNIY